MAEALIAVWSMTASYAAFSLQNDPSASFAVQ
jgi:hypothetical protein